MEYILTGREMAELDKYTIEHIGIPSLVLMENASRAMADVIYKNHKDKRILVIAGTGNNGADGLCICRILRTRGVDCRYRIIGNPEKATEQFQTQKEILDRLGYSQESAEQFWDNSWAEVVVDALFGVGLSRNITGKYAQAIEEINNMKAYKYAVDIPSGISATDGRVFGEAFQADATVTFQERKLGLFLFPGALYTGKVCVTDIGIDSFTVKEQLDTAYALEMSDIAKLLPERPPYAHKGTFGKLLLIAGSSGMAGAAFLSACAAYRMGAGLVRIYTTEDNRSILQQLIPEAIITTYTEYDEASLLSVLEWADAVCIGSGLGRSDVADLIVNTVLKEINVPCLIDADGINILAAHPEWKDQLAEGNYVLTPHLKELFRLTGRPVNEIQMHRREVLEQTARTLDVTLVQKDARTFVGAKGRRMYVNLTGNAAMAKAGSGDVLAGIIGGLMVQGCDNYDAAVLGVYLHGLAGDIARNEMGCYSVLARDLADALGSAIQMTENWKAEK